VQNERKHTNDHAGASKGDRPKHEVDIPPDFKDRWSRFGCGGSSAKRADPAKSSGDAGRKT